MTKKKILVLALTLAMVAILAVGGSLAYLTDTKTATNTFTVGNVKIELVEKNADDTTFTDNQTLLPGSKTENNIAKKVTVKNIGNNDAYMWIEVWIPSALDDGDDNSPQAPGLGNSLHFNFGGPVEETKFTYLGSKEIDNVSYNGYVHFVRNDTPVKKNDSSKQLLDQVYMDKKVTQCTDETHADNCVILMDGKTHYAGGWNLVINAIGYQADGVESIEKAITQYYGKDVTEYLW